MKIIDYLFICLGFFDGTQLKEISERTTKSKGRNIRRIYRQARKQCLKEAYRGGREITLVILQGFDYDKLDEVRKAATRLRLRSIDCEVKNVNPFGAEIKIKW